MVGPSLVEFSGTFNNILCCLTDSQLGISNARASKRTKKKYCISIAIVAGLGRVQDNTDQDLDSNAHRASRRKFFSEEDHELLHNHIRIYAEDQ